MLRWLRPPTVDNEFERVAIHTLHYVLQLLFIVAVLVILPNQGPLLVRIGQYLGLGVIIGCYILLQRGQLRPAVMIFLISSWLLITINALVLNGIYNSVLFFYVIIILFANLLFSWRVVLIFTGLSILSFLGLTVSYQSGIAPVYSTILLIEDQFLINRFLIAVAVFGAAGLLSSFSSNTIRHILTRLQQNEADLQAHNQELETMARNLAVSEARYRLLFDNANVAAAIYDSDGQIILVNEAGAKAVGKPRAELEGRNMREVFPAEFAAALSQMHQQVLATGEVNVFEGSTRLPTGGTMYYVRHVIPLPPSHFAGLDKPQILVLATDLTEQKQTLERQQELKAAREKLTFFTDFFSTVSHDIKTPLTVMETSLHLLERATEPAYRQEKITQLYEQVRLLEAYIQDMLMISRLEQMPTLHPEAIDLKAVTAAILQTLKPEAEEKRVQCTIEAEEPVIITADKDQIRRALTNLIENAIHYTPTDGQVCITIAQKTDASMITVSDTGLGIQPHDLPHIFEAFFRAPDAKAAVPSGSGLGLAIVKKIVELHGGSITVTSQPQQGSQFVVHLPTANHS